MVKLWYPEADAVSWSHSSNHLSLQLSHANWHLHEQSWKGGRGNPHCSQWHQPLWKSCPCPLYINQCQSQHQPGFQQDTQPREDTPGCWMVSCSGGSSKGTLLTFTEISVPLQGMQYIIPIFFTVLKRQDFFFPPKLTDHEKNISSLCLHRSSCFFANYNAFPIHREKGGPERNLQDISLGVLVA